MVVSKRKTKTSKKKSVTKGRIKTSKKNNITRRRTKTSTKRRTTRKYLKKKKGGERHEFSIRKDDNTISFPNGFPNLDINGDYHIIHAYDDTLISTRNKSAKLDQLQMWLTQTFQYTLPPNGNGLINKAANIFNSDQKEDFIALVNWLNDPNDNNNNLEMKM
jgi:hypothetical protein